MKCLIAVALTVQLVVPVVLVILIATMAGNGTDRTMDAYTRACANADSAATMVTDELTAAQLERAATIHAAAQDAGLGPRAAVIGIATAMQESALGADPAAMTGPNPDGDYGLFQQRTLVGWYANGPTQAANIRLLTNDARQARNFLLGHDTLDGSHIPGLVDINGWQTMDLTAAAQAVQRSAFPEAYAKWEPLAASLVDRFEGHPPGAVLCGATAQECAPTGLPSERGQTPDALLVMRCTRAQFPQITTLLGVRPGDPRDHGTRPRGRCDDPRLPHHRRDPAR